MKRRDFVKTLGTGAAAAAVPGLFSMCRRSERRPNIIYILADDLGYNELGCYGQDKIRTPNLDRLAEEGMLFTQHYAGSPVCAPSRCTLLTGRHPGHAYIRDNDEMQERGDVWNDPSIEGQRPLPEGTVTIGTALQAAGYSTGAIGKWGLGGPDDTGHPNKQGFDHWYGYLCQREAHNYYPPHLWRNQQKDILDGNTRFKPHQRFPEDADPHDPGSYSQYAGGEYAPDLMATEAMEFIRRNREVPFFLYLAHTIPHLALQVPEDSLADVMKRLAHYRGEVPVMEDERLVGVIWPEDVIERYNTEIFKRDMASSMASSLSGSRHVAPIPAVKNTSMVEVTVPASFVGQSLGSLDIRNRFKVTVLMVKQRDAAGEEVVHASPGADYTFRSGDVLLVIGPDDKVQHLERGQPGMV